MANAEHISKLGSGSAGMWHRWRRENPSVIPDFSGLRGEPLERFRQAFEYCQSNDALENLDLSGADFRGSELRRFHFGGSLFVGANFGPLLLQQMSSLEPKVPDADNSVSTDLAGSTFSWSKLGGADFSGADLTGVNFESADVRAADFRRCVGLFCETLQRARNWELSFRDPELACGEGIPTGEPDSFRYILQPEDITHGKPILGSPTLTENERAHEGLDANSPTSKGRSEQLGAPQQTLEENIISRPREVAERAKATKILATGLLDNLNRELPNDPDRQAEQEDLKDLLETLIASLDALVVALNKSPTAYEAKGLAGDIGDTYRQAIEAWTRIPAIDMTIKTALGATCLTLASFFAPHVNSFLSMTLLSIGVYGSQSVSDVLKSLKDIPSSKQ